MTETTKPEMRSSPPVRRADVLRVRWSTRLRSTQDAPSAEPVLVDHVGDDQESAWAYIGRQPVVDGTFDLVGYELRYQEQTHPGAEAASSDWSFAVEAVADFGLERLTGRHLAFIETSTDFISGDGYLVLPPQRVVLGLEGRALTMPAFRSAAERASALGYSLSARAPIPDDVGELLDCVKVEARVLRESGADLVARIRTAAPSARLIAYGVSTHSDLVACKALGVEAFSGSFVEQPTIVGRRSSTAPSAALLDLAAALQDAELSLRRVATILERDLALPYRLLRLVNSGSLALPSRVESIQDALVLLGTEAVRQLASVLAISTLAGRAEYLVEEFTARAKFCEVVAASLDPSSAAAAFTVGLFSGLELLLGEPMDQIVSQLPLSGPITDALTRRQGTLGDILSLAVDYERGYIDHIGPDVLRVCARAFDLSMAWASSLRHELRANTRAAANPVPSA